MCGWFAGTFRRDFCRTLFMFGTSHCCDSSSCYSDTFEFEPASAGAERQTLLSERVVCAPSLCFEHTTYCRELTHTPNAYKLEASNTRSSDRTCARGDAWLPTSRIEREKSLHASALPWRIQHPRYHYPTCTDHCRCRGCGPKTPRRLCSTYSRRLVTPLW